MRRKDADIKLILIDILLVVGLLLTLGALNTLIGSGFSNNAILWGGIGIGALTFSITFRILYNRYKARKASLKSDCGE